MKTWDLRVVENRPSKFDADWFHDEQADGETAIIPFLIIIYANMQKRKTKIIYFCDL